MSYYSDMTMDAFVIRTDLEDEQVREVIVGIYPAFYESGYRLQFSHEHEGKVYDKIMTEDDSAWGKHYEDALLAKIMSELIAEGENARLTFTGEDSQFWGWQVSRGNVVPLKVTAEEPYIFMTDTELRAEIDKINDVLKFREDAMKTDKFKQDMNDVAELLDAEFLNAPESIDTENPPMA